MNGQMDTDWAYLAALLEGEGSLNVFEQSRPDGMCWYDGITVGMNDEEPVRWTADLWGSSRHAFKHKGEPYYHYKTKCPANLTLPIIHNVFPYLKSRRKRMECLLLIAFRQTVILNGGASAKLPSRVKMFRQALVRASKAIKRRQHAV